MGLTDKIKNFIAPEEDEEELELSSEEVKKLSQYESPRSKEATGAAGNYDIVLFEPRHYGEATEIAEHLKSRRACAINLHRMPADYRQRIIDFLSGVVCAIDGSINKVGDDVFLFSPKSMPVGGQITINSEEADHE